MKPKAVLILSGGMDSVTLLYKLMNGYDVYTLSFDYGQRHKKELDCARAVTSRLGIPHKVVDITSINQLMEGSSLTRDDIAVPEGHYAEESMKATVVPNRNMILLSIATAWAVSLDAHKVFFAAHAGDRAQYPDCRQPFIDALSEATKIANFSPVTVEAPFIGMTKGGIAAVGKDLQVDYSQTWTCYKGLERPCLKCGSCVERTSAFEFAGIKDSLLTDDEWERALELYHSYQKEFDAKRGVGLSKLS